MRNILLTNNFMERNLLVEFWWWTLLKSGWPEWRSVS